MSSDNTISDISKGATKGLLEWSNEKISSLVRKFKDRKLTFIQDPKTIEIVKEQYISGESKFYHNYIKDNQILFLVRMGLTLRKLENDNERLQNLRDKIFKKYKVQGLHIAEFVQNGILNRYVGMLIEELTSIEDLERDIEEILKNIEKHALFIQGGIQCPEIVKKAFNIVSAHSPYIFIVSGIKSAAAVIKECAEKIETILKDYKLEKFSTSDKETLFFKRKLSK